MMDAGEYEDVVSKWTAETRRRWENSKFFKLWQKERKAGRDPKKAAGLKSSSGARAKPRRSYMHGCPHHVGRVQGEDRRPSFLISRFRINHRTASPQAVSSRRRFFRILPPGFRGSGSVRTE